MTFFAESTQNDIPSCAESTQNDTPSQRRSIYRLENVRFYRLFTGEGDMENTGCGNTGPRGLKARVLP